MKIRILSVLAIALGLAIPAIAADTPSALPSQIIDVRYQKCPVMGGTPKEGVALLKDGKVYHFCCPGCNGKFETEFETRSGKIVNPTEVPLQITNVDGKDPVTGELAVPEFFQVKGDTITFYASKDSIGKAAAQHAPLPTSGAAIQAPAGHAGHESHASQAGQKGHAGHGGGCCGD